MNFFIIEDDAVTARMLQQIIELEQLGTVVGMAESGCDVTASHLSEVDTVLIDLLMPGRDGIETIQALRAEGYDGVFVMISRVENKDMIAEAHLAGVRYYITKPVNRLELAAVLRKVSDYISLKQSLTTIRRSLSFLEEPALAAAAAETRSISQQMHQLMAQLGGAGETGYRDLCQMVSFLQRQEREQQKTLDDYATMKQLYEHLLRADNPALSDEQLQKDMKAFEQRLRRLIFQVLSHLASIGLTDYANPTFEYYAPRLFDFQEVRLRMQELKEEKKTSKCKVSIRKFVAALYTELKVQCF
jgi:two-component system response regulator YcbB